MDWIALSRSSRLLAGLGWLMAALAPPAGADTQVPYWSSHGYLAVNFTKTTGNLWLGNSNKSWGNASPIEAAINGRADISPGLSVTGQLLYRDAGEAMPYEDYLSLDYLLVDWMLYSSLQQSHNLLVGRDKIELGLFNKLRDVPLAHLGVYLPQSVYYERARFALTQDDGVFYRAQARDGDSEHELNVGYFVNSASNSDDWEYYMLLAPRPGVLKFKHGYDFAYRYRHSSTLTLSVTATQAFYEYEPENPGDTLLPGDTNAGSLVFSLDYFYSRKWRFTAEHLFGRSNARHFGPALDGDDGTLRYSFMGTYAQVLRSIGKSELYGRYDWFRLPAEDQQEFRALGVPDYALYAKDWTFGYRHYLTPTSALTAEVHFVDGTGWLTRSENRNPALDAPQWNIYALQYALTW